MYRVCYISPRVCCSCAVRRVDRGRHAVKGMGEEGAALAAALTALRGALGARGLVLPRGPPRAPPRPQRAPRFACPACGDVLRQPVTGLCGHTCCRECVRTRCAACGARARGDCATNVLVQRLVERWWSAELLSARAAHEAERLLHARGASAALVKCDKALHFCEYSNPINCLPFLLMLLFLYCFPIICFTIAL